MKDGIGLITPVKNEIVQLERLIKSIEMQTRPISTWIFVENDSRDGSAEFLRDLREVANVEHLIKLNLSFAVKTYQLGIRYSNVIDHGFTWLRKSEYYRDLDFIGILDADCFPEHDYYEKLIDRFRREPNLGILSGIITYPKGRVEKSNLDHARGGCRLWRKACFEDCPYEIGMSADSIAGVKAVLNGWRVKSIPAAKVVSRAAGSRYRGKYQGMSAYYRWIPFYYVFLKSVYYLARLRFRRAFGLLAGYVYAVLTRTKRLDNEQVAAYYKRILFRKIGLFIDRDSAEKK